MKIVCDCNYISYVEKFALSTGLSYRGGHTEIIYGFLKQILKLAQRFETNQLIFCWDSKDSLRKKTYPEYKANRRKDQTEEEKEANEIAYKQFNQLRRTVLPSMGFNNIFMQEGYEGDDLIAYIVRDHPCNVVITNDEDMLQLLDNCNLYNITKRSLTDKDEFIRAYGISPMDWVDVKSYAGCYSDNVKGLEGVGEKTVAKWLRGELKQTTKTYQKINSPEGWDIHRRNHPLVCLPLEGLPPIRLTKDSFLKKSFRDVFMEYGFNSFLENDKFEKWIKAFNLR